jgi:hypothetical protein
MSRMQSATLRPTPTNLSNSSLAFEVSMSLKDTSHFSGPSRPTGNDRGRNMFVDQHLGRSLNEVSTIPKTERAQFQCDLRSGKDAWWWERMIGDDLQRTVRSRRWVCEGQERWGIILAEGMDHLCYARDIIVRGAYESTSAWFQRRGGRYTSLLTTRGSPRDLVAAFVFPEKRHRRL